MEGEVYGGGLPAEPVERVLHGEHEHGGEGDGGGGGAVAGGGGEGGGAADSGGPKTA